MKRNIRKKNVILKSFQHRVMCGVFALALSECDRLHEHRGVGLDRMDFKTNSSNIFVQLSLNRMHIHTTKCMQRF